jgi:hypothetical protein
VGSFSPVYVNTGGTAYGVWAADTGCQTTNAATYSVGNPIAGTTDQTLYQSLRYGLSNLTCTYSVPAGNYRVRLKFAELYWTSANQRVFDVQINGVTVDTGVDPFTRAGGIYRAVDGVYNVTVSGSQLAITLVQRSGLPAVNGIEIQSVPYTPVLVNVGGPAYSVWSADSGCSNGTLYSVANAIGNTADQQVYQTLRYSGSGSQNCSYAVPNGSYTVKLKLAELYWTVTGQRVFDVQINGTTVDTNLDLFGRAGAVYRAYDPSYTVTVTGGQINISLVPRIGLPSLNGVDIR